MILLMMKRLYAVAARYDGKFIYHPGSLIVFDRIASLPDHG